MITMMGMAAFKEVRRIVRDRTKNTKKYTTRSCYCSDR